MFVERLFHDELVHHVVEISLFHEMENFFLDGFDSLGLDLGGQGAGKEGGDEQNRDDDLFHIPSCGIMSFVGRIALFCPDCFLGNWH